MTTWSTGESRTPKGSSKIDRLSGSLGPNQITCSRMVGEIVAGAGVGEDGQAVAVERQPLREIAELPGSTVSWQLPRGCGPTGREMEMADRDI